MDVNEITFENLPKAIAHLVDEVEKLKLLVEKNQTQIAPKKRMPIGIDEASLIIGKAKPTIYSMVHDRMIPCYKNGKKLYFLKMNSWNGLPKAKRKQCSKLKMRQK